MSLPSRKIVLPYTEKTNSKIIPIETPVNKKNRVANTSNERVKRVLNTSHPIARLKQNTKHSLHFSLPAIANPKTSSQVNASQKSLSALDFYETYKVPMSTLVHFKKDDYAGTSLIMSKRDEVLYSTTPEIYNPNTFISSNIGLRWNEINSVVKDEEHSYRPNLLQQHKQLFFDKPLSYHPDMYHISVNNTLETEAAEKPFINKLQKLEPTHKPTVFDHHWQHTHVQSNNEKFKIRLAKPFDEISKKHANHLEVLVETEYNPRGTLRAYPSILRKSRYSGIPSTKSNISIEENPNQKIRQEDRDLAAEEKSKQQKVKQVKLHRLHEHEKRIDQYIEESNHYQEKRDRGIRTNGYDVVRDETPGCW